MRILITNEKLAGPGGTQFYVRDLAGELLRRGHQPIVYSPQPGPLAQDMARTGVEVTDDLGKADLRPNIIHGHGWLPALTAVAYFPELPAIFVGHNSDVRQIPRHPSFRRYLAVDLPCRDRLLMEGVDERLVQVVLNSVDLLRFKPRPPLPPRPAKALLFSNYTRWSKHFTPISEACRQAGIALDIVGSGVTQTTSTPEAILGQYDIVFGKARCALESMAVGAAVIMCGVEGLGPMVSSADFGRLRPMNFGRGACPDPLEVEAILRQIRRYDPRDAAAVSAKIRAEASLSQMCAEIEKVYRKVIEEHRAQELSAKDAARAWTAILTQSSHRMQQIHSLHKKLANKQRRIKELREAIASAKARLAELQALVPVRMSSRLSQLPIVSHLLGAGRRAIRRVKPSAAKPPPASPAKGSGRRTSQTPG